MKNEDVSGGLEMLKEVARLRFEISKLKVAPCIKCNYISEDRESIKADYTLLIMNDRVLELETLL